MLVKSFIVILFFGLAAASSGVFAAEFKGEELTALGQSYAQAINDLDADAFSALISNPHLAQEIADFAGDSASEKLELFRAFEEAMPGISKRMLKELERQGSRAVFLRVHEFDGMRGPLVRYSVGDGYNYVLLLPVRPADAGSSALIGDMYYATGGELLSETMGIATKLVVSPSETFLGKLFGVNEVDQDLVSRFGKIGQLRQQNKLKEAFEVLDQIPGGARNHRVILMNTIQIASQLDEGLYREELRRLAKYHGDDPRAAFTLLDHYFFENDLDGAMSIIDLMEESYGSDAVLYLFRANVELARSRIDAALGFADSAVQLEPGNEEAQWTRLTILVEAEMFGESVGVLQLLESEFGYLFAREDFEADPLYAEFVRSEEFAQWMDAPH
jgi:tetratricopeptide (TPR) repeat protein